MGARIGIVVTCDGRLCDNMRWGSHEEPPSGWTFYNLSLPVLMDPERAFSMVEEWKVEAAKAGGWNYNPVTNRMLCNGCSEAEAGEQ